MKPNLRSLTLLVMFVIANAHALFSQTINYQTWTPPSPVPCNIFGQSRNVNGFEHLSNIGQPKYGGSTNKTIDLICSSGTKGTEYQIAYNFKQGFRYSITVVVATIQSTPSAFSSLRLRIRNGGAGSNNDCNGEQTIDVSGSGPLTLSHTINNTSYTSYTYEFPVLTSANSHLQVAAVPAAGASSQTMQIRSINIVETQVNPELVLSPTTVNTVCGTNYSQTFTVANPSNVPGITSYEWNLGSANNGWLYGGSPAPQNISTTANNITLVANGCRTTPLANVAVTVNKNGVAYKTYTAIAQTAQPTLTINGPDRICSGSASYNIPGLPCNAQVSWSVQPGSGSTLGCTPCAQTSLQFLTDGSTTLTASVQLPCNPSPIVIQKEILTGAPNPLDGIIYNTNDGVFTDPFLRLINGATQIYVEFPALANYNPNYTWQIQNADPSFSFTKITGNYFLAAFNSPSSFPVSGTVRLNVTHPQCGFTPTRITFYINPGEGLQLQASPVPANNMLNVTLTGDKDNQLTTARKSTTSSAKVARIQIVDKMGSIKIDQKAPGSSSTGSVDVSGLINDIYILKVFDGQKWWSKQIVVQH